MSDVYTIETDLGNITVTKMAIGKIVTKAVGKWNGKVLITNHKGKLTNIMTRLTGNDVSNYMDIDFEEEGLDLKIYAAVKFGTSIGTVTNSLIEDIHDGIKKTIGIEPLSVSVVVTGTISRNIARRNIEVRKTYDI